MSQSRISWIEQNIEKVVMGIVGATLVGVVALQALHQPNKVKVGPGPELPPEKAFGPVEKSAIDLNGKTNSTNPPRAPKVTVDLPRDLDGKLKTSVSTTTKMAQLGPGTRIESAGEQGPVGTDLFAEAKIPAPSHIIGAAHAGTIHPLEHVWHPDLATVLPAQQPFDKMGVSVEGTFSGVALVEALAADPDGEGPVQPLPLGLWQDPMTREVLVDIVQVELERELVRPAPGSTEAVGTKAVVSGMPGRFDVKKHWDDNVRTKGDEVAELHQFGGARIGGHQAIEGIAQSEKVLVRGFGGHVQVGQG